MSASDLRLTPHLKTPVIFYTKPPFSNFDFIEKEFGYSIPLFRIFSQARCSNFLTLVSEKINSVGFSEEDDLELKNAGYVLSDEPPLRLSFFTNKVKNVKALKKQRDRDFLGYAIMKKVPLRNKIGYKWIVFESVIVNNRYANNYIPNKKKYSVNVGNNILNIEGVLYCQQNNINNTCAHVALRTCISLMLESGDISCKRINDILAESGHPFHIETKGLSDSQILLVLDKLNISYSRERYLSRKELLDSRGVIGRLEVEKEGLAWEEVSKKLLENGLAKIINSEQVRLNIEKGEDNELFSKVLGAYFEKIRTILNNSLIKKNPEISYQSYLYGSIESGFPALLAFSIPNSSIGHVIPCFGHTFNDDIWVSRADPGYFNIGKNRYLQSDYWLSTYICHDDNFGSSYCLPKQYLTEDYSIFVVAMRPKDISYDAILANAIALDYLVTSLAGQLRELAKVNVWAKRLLAALYGGIGVDKGGFILRALQVSSKQYIKHLRLLRGWGSDSIIPEDHVKSLENNLKEDLWIVEISLPELFPANRRKLGEIVLDPAGSFADKKNVSNFLFARILGKFYILKKCDQDQLEVTEYDAGINTHTDLFSFAQLTKKGFYRTLLNSIRDLLKEPG